MHGYTKHQGTTLFQQCILLKSLRFVPLRHSFSCPSVTLRVLTDTAAEQELGRASEDLSNYRCLCCSHMTSLKRLSMERQTYSVLRV